MKVKYNWSPPMMMRTKKATGAGKRERTTNGVPCRRSTTWVRSRMSAKKVLPAAADDLPQMIYHHAHDSPSTPVDSVGQGTRDGGSLHVPMQHRDT